MRKIKVLAYVDAQERDQEAARLREVLHYDPETGKFTHLRRYPPAYPGNEAGYIDHYGYRVLSVDGHKRPAHVWAWIYMTGKFPMGHVDHRNGIRDDNRWSNLRVVKPAENYQNRRVAGRHSKSGLLGASPYRGEWCATIQVDKRRIWLGRHPTAEAAHLAYLEAKARLHPAWDQEAMG